ncbi:MAG: PDZ domain-containing protein [Marinilabiliales bacterium]|nr:PDZ domain-containing protein [Marinilabiliales bacterium]
MTRIRQLKSRRQQMLNKFIYNALATYYLWEDNIPALNDPKYENSDSLNVFLNRYTDPEALFDDLLYSKDKWSFIVDSAEEIENWINAISESVGMDFRLYYISSTGNNLIGVIRYVLKDSPAEKAGLKKGDMFMTVNGQQLTDCQLHDFIIYPEKLTPWDLHHSTGAILHPTGEPLT